MLDNNALVLTRRGGDLEVARIPEVQPGPGQIRVRARAVAVNPIDRYLQHLSGVIAPWLRYPAVLGSDVAGEVDAVGEGVDKFKVGDRVLGLALGTAKGRSLAEGAFQQFVLLDAHVSSPIPAAMSYEEAAVLPLGLATAASALFQADLLASRTPSATLAKARDVILVWGAATSVGANAVQLAAAAGYEVVATASPRNHAWVSRLGAVATFDRRSPTVISELRTYLSRRSVLGALAIGAGSTRACIEVLGDCPGRRFVAAATPAVTFDDYTRHGGGLARLVPVLTHMAVATMGLQLRARRLGVRSAFVIGSRIADGELGPIMFDTFLPGALTEGRYAPSPPPLVVGRGLEAIPEALSKHAQGVSARKLVVTL